MLAAAVPAAGGQKVLELGSGAGTASLCLSARVSGLAITGVEIDASLVALAKDNAAANGADVSFVQGDIFALPPDLKLDFDQVFCNPPFHGEGQASPDAARATALMDHGKLSDWLKLGLQRTVSGGFLPQSCAPTASMRRWPALPEQGVCACRSGPAPREASKRVIVQARKGSGAPFALLPGLVLHQENGAWTHESEAVLRRGEALALSGARL